MVLNKAKGLMMCSIGSRMVRGGGARNMKYKEPPMAAIFFMTSFNRERGAMAPCPLDPQLMCAHNNLRRSYNESILFFEFHDINCTTMIGHKLSCQESWPLHDLDNLSWPLRFYPRPLICLHLKLHVTWSPNLRVQSKMWNDQIT